MSLEEIFGKASLEEVNTEAKAQETRVNYQFHKIKSEENNVFRILPPAKGLSKFWEKIVVHFYTTSSGKVRSFLCTSELEGKCPFCEKWAKFKSEGNDKKASLVSRKTRFLFNALNEKGEYKILQLPKTVKETLVNQIQMLGQDITDIKTGRNLIVKKTGFGIKTEYTLVIAPNPTEIDMSVLKEITELHDLSAIYPKISYDKISEIINKEETPQSKPEDAFSFPQATPLSDKGESIKVKTETAPVEDSRSVEEQNADEDPASSLDAILGG